SSSKPRSRRSCGMSTPFTRATAMTWAWAAVVAAPSARASNANLKQRMRRRPGIAGAAAPGVFTSLFHLLVDEVVLAELLQRGGIRGREVGAAETAEELAVDILVIALREHGLVRDLRADVDRALRAVAERDVERRLGDSGQCESAGQQQGSEQRHRDRFLHGSLRRSVGDGAQTAGPGHESSFRTTS